MKHPLPLVFSLVAAALFGGCMTPSREVPFTLTRQQFDVGDSITIEKVLAPSSPLKIGDNVVVMGRYELASRPKARIGLSISTAAPTPTRGSNLDIVAGSGKFQLPLEMQAAGGLHLSLNDPTGSFGGVNFEVGF